MESGTIVKWLKAEGEPVKKGEPLYELDTDKVTQEVEAEADGVLLAIAVREGEVPVGQTIAVIGTAGETYEVTVPAAPAPAAVASVAPAPVEATRARSSDRERRPHQGIAARAADRPRAGDRAARADRHRARRQDRRRGCRASGRGHGSGSGGAPAEPVEGVELVPLTSLRKTIARRMTEAWQAPAFQISMSADMSRAQELRARLVELHDGEGAKPTISDVLTKVCAVALMRHRAVNALFAGDAIELHPTANVGIAVALPGGLVVPVIPSCERKTIAELADARADVVGRARDGKLTQADLDGGTFTISNLGMYGVEGFVAVLNPPQAAILAVGAIEEKPVVRDGDLEIVPLMQMTLTCDHRSLDGATAAEFLGTVKAFLEEPGLAL